MLRHLWQSRLYLHCSSPATTISNITKIFQQTTNGSHWNRSFSRRTALIELCPYPNDQKGAINLIYIESLVRPQVSFRPFHDFYDLWKPHLSPKIEYFPRNQVC